jgi:O-6-methylguanine DNA methyltransferase
MLRNFDTPFGKYFVEIGDGLITHAYFGEFDGDSPELKTGGQLMSKLHRYCSSLRLQPQGTPFQLQVWKCIGGVTSGKIATYKEIACGLGYPSAVRAVASAISRNPIAYLIPCHRIVRSNGEIGGYRWNSSRKKMILNYENIQVKFPSL